MMTDGADNGGLDLRFTQLTFEDESAEYAAFVKKFHLRKKNTDDCYTPLAVYDAVLAWVRNRYQITDDVPIVRPFFPGGDYERAEYPSRCVVVDNPPFSLARRIFKFYARRGIKFFCFYAGLMALRGCSRAMRTGAVIAPPGVIVYANGANVRTSFVTNLGDEILEISHELGASIERARNEKLPRAAVKRVRRWPRQTLCSSAHLFSLKRDLRINFADAAEIDTLDNCGKIFGGGLLLSARAAELVKQVEQVELVKQVEQVELSARELAAVRNLEKEWGRIDESR